MDFDLTLSADIADALPKACNVSINWCWVGALDYAGRDIEDICFFSYTYLTAYRQRMDGSDRDKTQ